MPAGTFKDAVKVEARMRMHIYLSGTKKTIQGTDVMTAWFVKGVGLVKYVERQELSPLEDRGVVTDIMEELESYEIKPRRPHSGGAKPRRRVCSLTMRVTTNCIRYSSPPAFAPTPDSRWPPNG